MEEFESIVHFIGQACVFLMLYVGARGVYEDGRKNIGDNPAPKGFEWLWVALYVLALIAWKYWL